MSRSISTLVAAVAALITPAVATAAPAVLTVASQEPITITARGADSRGIPQRRSVPLLGLDRTQVDLLRRPSSSSVVVGWPSSKRLRTRNGRLFVRRPCATATFRARIVPTGDPLAAVAATVPKPIRSIAVSSPDTSAVTGAARTGGAPFANRRVTFKGVAARALPIAGATALRRVDVTITIPDDTLLGYCAVGSGQYTSGPYLEAAILLLASSG